MFDAVQWEDDLGGKTVQAAWDTFKDHYNHVIESCIPVSVGGLGKKAREEKWMTRKVMSEIKNKEIAWIRYRKTKSARCLRAYRVMRNKATRAVREAKKKFEENLSKEVKTTPKAFYAYARSKTTIKEQVMAVRNEQGVLSSSLDDVYDIMNEKFEKVYVNAGNMTPPVLPTYEGEKLENILISREVEKTLCALQSSSPGPDEVHPEVLRNCARSLSKPLTMIFQESLRTGHIPNDWKRANITPIYKKGCRSDPLNYRPISLTSSACKVLERII